MAVDIKVAQDNSEEVLSALERQIRAALEAVGNQAVSHTKKNITEASRIDTGLMRNSITYALDGEATAITTYKADTGEKTGSYTGNAPEESKGKAAVYVGTNVEYAIYQEMGTGKNIEGGRKTSWRYQDKKGSTHTTSGIKPAHFLKNAIENHKDEYRKIIKKYLKG